MSTDKAMTPAELKHLRSLEREIDECLRHMRKGAQAAQKAAERLAEIKESMYYRHEYPSWDAYLKDRWGMGRTKGDQLVKAAPVLRNLFGPPGEGEARDAVDNGPSLSAILPLARLDPSLQADAYAAAKSGPEKPPLPERLRDIVSRVKDAEPSERAQIIKEEEQASRRRAESRQKDALADERARRWRKVLNAARVGLKDARGLGDEAEDVIGWLEKVILRACDELDEDPYKHKIRRDAA